MGDVRPLPDLGRPRFMSRPRETVSFFSQALFSMPDRGHRDRKAAGAAGAQPVEGQRAEPLGDPGLASPFWELFFCLPP